MDTWSIVVTVICFLLALAITIIGAQRGKGPRHIVQGIGWMLLPLGLLFSGVMALIVKGTQYTYDWLMTTYLDLQHKIGLGLAVAGVLFLLGSLLIKRRTREQAAEARSARQTPIKASAQTKSLPAKDAQSATPTAAPAKAKPAAPGMSDEDAEIEALLRKRGIK